MRVIAIHGVNVRDAHWCDDEGVTASLKKFVGPAIGNPDVTVYPVYWGDVGVSFAWNRLTRLYLHQARPGFDRSVEGHASAAADLDFLVRSFRQYQLRRSPSIIGT
jgi:hypothetical protein